ncbi:helix-turn-helix transcriptional regulator [Algoriphagus sp. NG3]|uniref:helix-turn-helix domain-containing protein n=1 Tax=Algoriphagus sp. NG3 TaxID=3097546 RepID=UPI002A7FFC6F|nr:helix-turn-helix transcriptional regulator [Algoriphagus sp. NG3]WPR75765.1 helix-turn-helix transcriptional regulator [Algoriphagus sp. NG3]
MEIVKIPLTIERQGGKELWGRVEFNDNLITDFAETVAELEAKIKGLLWDFEELAPEQVEFTYQYDIYALFQKFDFLKISTVAEHAGMNPGLLRQYVSGAKSPSQDQAKKIERMLHKLAAELQEAIIVTS